MNFQEQFTSGMARHAQRYLGVHPAEPGSVFRVWAPGVRSVRVIGDFNDWRPEAGLMAELGSGIFELSVANACPGQCYKYLIEDQNGALCQHADPYARQAELRPKTASIISYDEAFDWQDEAFKSARPHHRAAQPINIYEMHLGSWRRQSDGRFLSFDELGDELIPYLLEMNYTYVEFMPVQEHPLDASWGYQLSGYYAVSSRFGSATQFKRLIRRLHLAGIGVILDWVPAHFPKDDYGLARFNGQALYEYGEEELGERKVWGTLVFDFGRPEVRSFLRSNAFYWVEEFHVDGLRFDAVSSMLYRDYDQAYYDAGSRGDVINHEALLFLRELNRDLHAAHPQLLTFAEESSNFEGVTRTADEGGLDFSFKWNLGWMHDTLDYFSSDYVHRPYQHRRMTFSLTYAFDERFLLPFSHDEVVHGKRALMEKMPGDYWRKFASYRTLLAYMMTHPGAKLLFMGGEFGQFTEWHYYEPLDWFVLSYDMHQKLQHYVSRLNALYRDTPVLWKNDRDWSGFCWVDADDAERSVFSYIRNCEGEAPCLVLLNMLPSPVEDFQIGVPLHGRYQVLLNSDDEVFGGSGYPLLDGQFGLRELWSDERPCGALPHTLSFRLSPLACLILQYKDEPSQPGG